MFYTDESWQVRRSNITFSNLYDGEWQDSTLRKLPVESAKIFTGAMPSIRDRFSTPVTIAEERKAKELFLKYWLK